MAIVPVGAVDIPGMPPMPCLAHISMLFMPDLSAMPKWAAKYPPTTPTIRAAMTPPIRSVLLCVSLVIFILFLLYRCPALDRPPVRARPAVARTRSVIGHSQAGNTCSRAEHRAEKDTP